MVPIEVKVTAARRDQIVRSGLLEMLGRGDHKRCLHRGRTQSCEGRVDYRADNNRCDHDRPNGSSATAVHVWILDCCKHSEPASAAVIAAAAQYHQGDEENEKCVGIHDNLLAVQRTALGK